MLRRPPRTTRTDTLFPTRRSSDLNGGLRVRRAPSRGEGLAEDQHVAELGDVFLFLEQVEIPAAVGGIAIEHRADDPVGSEEHTSELQSLMRSSYAVFCLKKKNKQSGHKSTNNNN